MKLSLCTQSFVFVISTALLASLPAQASKAGLRSGTRAGLRRGRAACDQRLGPVQSAAPVAGRGYVAHDGPSADFFVLRGLSVDVYTRGVRPRKALQTASTYTRSLSRT